MDGMGELPYSSMTNGQVSCKFPHSIQDFPDRCNNSCKTNQTNRSPTRSRIAYLLLRCNFSCVWGSMSAIVARIPNRQPQLELCWLGSFFFHFSSPQPRNRMSSAGVGKEAG